MESPTEKQKRVWRRSAATYDRKIAGAERGMLAGGREWLAARASGRVLEVAIGTGRSLPYYPANVQLTGVDLSAEMLKLARQRAAEIQLSPELIEADAEHLPFDSGSFDTVVCALAMCSIPDRAAALAEMRRVLVPGGTLLLLDHIGSSWPPIFVLQWIVERFTIPFSGEYFTRRSLRLVRDTGFELVEQERSKAGMVERLHARAP